MVSMKALQEPQAPRNPEGTATTLQTAMADAQLNGGLSVRPREDGHRLDLRGRGTAFIVHALLLFAVFEAYLFHQLLLQPVQLAGVRSAQFVGLSNLQTWCTTASSWRRSGSPSCTPASRPFSRP